MWMIEEVVMKGNTLEREQDKLTVLSTELVWQLNEECCALKK